jgi:hypothetical protein
MAAYSYSDQVSSVLDSFMQDGSFDGQEMPKHFDALQTGQPEHHSSTVSKLVGSGTSLGPGIRNHTKYYGSACRHVPSFVLTRTV